MTRIMQLDLNEVHIYTAALTVTPREQQSLRLLLNREEQVRADRFVAPIHQQRFIAAHGILRQLLASYLNTRAEAIEFTYSDHQKPALAAPYHDQLHFNLSHSHDLAAFAFIRTGAIGIDIEKITPDSKIDVAERFFSQAESDALKQAPETLQATLFYRLWSRKEAIIKANGKGLSQPLHSFSVSTTDQPETVQVDEKNWMLYPLTLHPNFAGALASATPIKRLSFWEVIHQEPVFKTSVFPFS